MRSIDSANVNAGSVSPRIETGVSATPKSLAMTASCAVAIRPTSRHQDEHYVHQIEYRRAQHLPRRILMTGRLHRWRNVRHHALLVTRGRGGQEQRHHHHHDALAQSEIEEGLLVSVRLNHIGDG